MSSVSVNTPVYTATTPRRSERIRARTETPPVPSRNTRARTRVASRTSSGTARALFPENNPSILTLNPYIEQTASDNESISSSVFDTLGCSEEEEDEMYAVCDSDDDEN